MIAEPKPYSHPDPFPEITNAQKNLWNFLDWWAYRRLRRIGMPSPWGAFGRGYDRALEETRFVRNEQTLISFERDHDGRLDRAKR